MSPYQGQTQILQEMMQEMELSENVRTIDSWQGRDKEIIFFSAVRCNPNTLGFLSNAKRMNVALTRAQHGMIIVANAKTLSLDTKW